MDKNGLLLCARYSAAPNFFGYCGPNKSAILIDHLTDNAADSEVTHILSEFETLFPYLELIARKNRIIDPYDHRVVEAYWLGNKFQKPVSQTEYAAFLTERLSIDKKISTAQFMGIRDAVNQSPFYPHHAFHVFNIFRRTGADPSFHTLSTMDECRIGWGTVTNITQSENETIIDVAAQPLQFDSKTLKLSGAVQKKLRTDYKDKEFLKKLTIGDAVSFHWSFVCDKLSSVQVKNLRRFTQGAIDFFNSRNVDYTL